MSLTFSVEEAGQFSWGLFMFFTKKPFDDRPGYQQDDSRYVKVKDLDKALVIWNGWKTELESDGYSEMEKPVPWFTRDDYLGNKLKKVEELREDYGFPGMCVLQFAFDGQDPTNQFLPHNCTRRTVIYTGTHDNDTSLGWFPTLSLEDQEFFWRYADRHRVSDCLDAVELDMLEIERY